MNSLVNLFDGIITRPLHIKHYRILFAPVRVIRSLLFRIGLFTDRQGARSDWFVYLDAGVRA